MDDESVSASDIPADGAAPVGPRGGNRPRLLMIGGIAGGLVLAAYAYSAFRWGPLDSITVLGLIFGLLLLGYAALAVVGVRAGVVAPFVVAALLLPWVCGAAAAAGLGQRVGGAIDDFSNDLSGTSSLMEPAAPLTEDSVEPAPSGSDFDALAEAEETFPSPPPDASTANTFGKPVAFEQDLGGGDIAPWKVTVKDVQCGVKSLKKAEYNTDGSMGTAKPRSGHEFCLVQTTWTNDGKAEAGGATVLGNLMVAGTAIERLDKDVYRAIAVMQQRNLDGMTTIKPGKTSTQLDVFEVPDGTVPDAVWISRDQPTVLAALK